MRIDRQDSDVCFAATTSVERAGYQNFGSFHTDNVEVLVRDQSWVPPENWVREPLHISLAPGFGAPFRQHFLIDFTRWTFINHGAFGATLRGAQAEAAAWRERCELQPLAFLDR